MLTTEPEPERPSQPWDSLCVSKDCPIKHPHNFGLRPQIFPTPVIIWQDADAVVPDHSGYLDTQPPPLIKAMIDTLRDDPMIMVRYPRFMDILRDFYRVHGGRSDVYHGPAGMFGLGMDISGDYRYGFYPYHKHPDEEEMGGWFAFEVVENDNSKNFRGKRPLLTGNS